MAVAQEVNVSTQEEQFVVFELLSESYCLDIGVVNTIIRMQPITHVPRAPEFVDGVINLRGNIIPVIDLRKCFNIGAYEETKSSRIVVVETATSMIGLIVDAVTETLSLQADSIEPPSSLVMSHDSQYIKGVAKHAEKLIILLDIKALLEKTGAEDLRELTENM